MASLSRGALTFKTHSWCPIVRRDEKNGSLNWYSKIVSLFFILIRKDFALWIFLQLSESSAKQSQH